MVRMRQLRHQLARVAARPARFANLKQPEQLRALRRFRAGPSPLLPDLPLAWRWYRSSCNPDSSRGLKNASGFRSGWPFQTARVNPRRFSAHAAIRHGGLGPVMEWSGRAPALPAVNAGRGTEDKERAMSQKLDTSPARRITSANRVRRRGDSLSHITDVR